MQAAQKTVPRYLTTGEQRVMQQDIQGLRKTERNARELGTTPGVDLAHVARLRSNIEDSLSKQTAPDLNADERDRADKLIKKLEAEISEGMLSQECMRRNPAGAVDRHLAWEERNKHRIAAWRATQQSLYKGDPELDSRLSVERLRPATSPINYDDAQIPRTRIQSVFRGEEWAATHARIFDGSPERERERMEAKLADSQERLADMEASVGLTARQLAESRAEVEELKAKLAEAIEAMKAPSQQQGRPQHQGQHRK